MPRLTAAEAAEIAARATPPDDQLVDDILKKVRFAAERGRREVCLEGPNQLTEAQARALRELGYEVVQVTDYYDRRHSYTQIAWGRRERADGR